MRIEIEQPRQSWVEDFVILKRAVMGAAPAGAYLHHIGSTAIPGLPAKDIIDIQLTVNELADVDADAFERAGFERRPIVIDHCPPGLELAEGARPSIAAKDAPPICISGKEAVSISVTLFFAATSCAPIRQGQTPTP
ncbi:GrpB family protein [Rhizobium sp. WYCCWR 11128]|uniref:GrpB family protein n=1 Tax=Rhizobium sp. WYCCWR 11128 TaxID=2749832 RepID=UPI002484A031|nr:GrpB family protein [Rhizobium sp. WYCCWR 11128]